MLTLLHVVPGHLEEAPTVLATGDVVGNEEGDETTEGDGLERCTSCWEVLVQSEVLSRARDERGRVSVCEERRSRARRVAPVVAERRARLLGWGRWVWEGGGRQGGRLNVHFGSRIERAVSALSILYSMQTNTMKAAAVTWNEFSCHTPSARK